MENWLVFRQPDGQERRWCLQNVTTTIGRAPENDIHFENELSISRQHASVVLQDGGYYVIDLGSTSGTRVNLEAVQRQRLVHGDQLLLGKVVLVFETANGEAVPRAQSFDAADDPDSVGSVIKSLDDLMVEDESSDFNKASPRLNSGASRSQTLRRPDTAEPEGRSTELEKNNLKLKIMYRVASQMNTAPTLRRFLEEVLEMAFHVVGAERGFLQLKDDGEPGSGLRLSRFLGSGESTIMPSETIANASMEQKVAILVHDAQVDSRFCQEDSIQLYGIRSALCVPIWSGQKIYGVLYVDCVLRSRSFLEEDLELLTALANLAATSVERHRLIEACKAVRGNGS